MIGDNDAELSRWIEAICDLTEPPVVPNGKHLTIRLPKNAFSASAAAIKNLPDSADTSKNTAKRKRGGSKPKFDRKADQRIVEVYKRLGTKKAARELGMKPAEVRKAVNRVSKRNTRPK